MQTPLYYDPRLNVSIYELKTTEGTPQIIANLIPARFVTTRYKITILGTRTGGIAAGNVGDAFFSEGVYEYYTDGAGVVTFKSADIHIESIDDLNVDAYVSSPGTQIPIYVQGATNQDIGWQVHVEKFN